MNNFSLYIHIPFCIKKCSYCDFLSFPSTEKVKEEYINALCNEIKTVSIHQKAAISTIFIGGGTPTVLTGKQLKRIVDCIYEYYYVLKDCEVSIEVNPKTLDDEKLEFIKNGPINRVSIGLQSIFEHHLKTLSRIHTYKDFLSTYNSLRMAGICNINIDLMFGLPNQTFSEWKETLETIVKLKPEHISAYGLIIEEGTAFFEMYENNELILPDENLEREMYYLTDDLLKEQNILQYEISNYSLEGFESKHNLAYWTDVNYIGLGLGASSYIYGFRYTNTNSMDIYLEHSSNIEIIRELVCKSSKSKRMEEAIFLGLRLTKGIKLASFNKAFNNPFENIYKVSYDKHITNNCLEVNDGYLRLTRKGIDVSNQVFSDFILGK